MKRKPRETKSDKQAFRVWASIHQFANQNLHRLQMNDVLVLEDGVGRVQIYPIDIAQALLESRGINLDSEFWGPINPGELRAIYLRGIHANTWVLGQE